MSCHDIGRGIDSVTQVVIKMYDAEEITGLKIFKIAGLFHPMKLVAGLDLYTVYLDKIASTGSITGLPRMN